MVMIKVCHMTSAHNAEDIRIFHKECTSLAKAGYDVYLVERGDSYEKNGVHIIGVGDIPGNRIKRMTDGAKKVYEKALAVDADLYHFHDPELMPYALKLKKKGKKVVFDSHEHYRSQILHKEYLPKICRKIIAGLYGAYEDNMLSKIDGVIFPCPMDGVFPLECAHRAYVDNPPMLSELYDKYDENEPKVPNSVCLIGSLTYNRGITHFVKAVSKAGCKAFVGGVFSPESLRDEVLSYEGIDNIEFLGRLNRDEVLSVLKKSMVGISAPLNLGQYNHTDNIATKTCEYMSMGLPVIMTRQPFIEKMLKQYDFGICVDPEDTEEYANAINYLLNNPEKARRLGQNGRKTIKEVLNWEKEQNNLLGLYREILED
ncbi:MAG: glycosyltransferase family 4 protein [Lachnospiraceae bacterium]|nr:glycosyltransferase family 4 protein [Lachnospiraceae bacterium]